MLCVSSSQLAMASRKSSAKRKSAKESETKKMRPKLAMAKRRKSEKNCFGESPPRFRGNLVQYSA